MKQVATFCKYKMKKKIGSTFLSVLVVFNEVTIIFYEHTNLGSKLKRIERSQLVEELQETCKLASLECEQQNLAKTSNRFSKLAMLIPIHIIDLSQNHTF
jgi:hypothetical protein